MIPTYSRALIVGAGSGLSASLARLLAADGLKIGLAARNVDKLAALAAETGAAVHACDASRPGEVEALFARLEPALGGAPDVVVYNASGRLRGPVADLDPEAVARGADGLRLWRLPGGAGRGAPHAAAPPRRDPSHRRVGEREGLRRLGALRHGQVRPARASARASPASCSRRASTWPTS